jgi:L-rhamnose mutarotase
MRYCLALDLQKDPALIAEYEAWHRDVWPEIKQSILGAGVTEMEIWRLEDRLFMILETDRDFSFEKWAAMDAANPTVKNWEELMWKYQAAVPGGRPDEKWRLMDRIFLLKKSY